MNHDTAYRKYRVQRTKALQLGIGFTLSFGQWLRIWMNSEHWKDRGRRQGQYVMARKNREKPYSVRNVKIILQAQNNSEKVWSAETRMKLRAAYHKNQAKVLAGRWPRPVEA